LGLEGAFVDERVEDCFGPFEGERLRSARGDYTKEKGEREIAREREEFFGDGKNVILKGNEGQRVEFQERGKFVSQGKRESSLRKIMRKKGSLRKREGCHWDENNYISRRKNGDVEKRKRSNCIDIFGTQGGSE